MRWTGWGMRTVRPTSSVTSRKAGDAGEIEVALCARVNAAQDSKAAIATKTVLRRREGANSFTNLPPDEESHFTNKKAPRDTLGLPASLLLAKSAASCGMGGWPGLRLFSRSQWRDRGRFARPSPLPLPAN